MTARSIILVRASTRIRRLFKQQPAVRRALHSCSLMMPATGLVCNRKACFFHCLLGARQLGHRVLQEDKTLCIRNPLWLKLYRLKPRGTG